MNLRAPRHATVVAYLALGVALSGSAYAAGQLTGRDVRDASPTGRDVANSTLTGADVRSGSLGDRFEDGAFAGNYAVDAAFFIAVP